MRLCIPTLDDQGLRSRVSAHFGSAPCLLLLDTETEQIESVSNEHDHSVHGTCHPLTRLEGQALDAFVVGNIGRGAFQALARQGIAVYRTDRTTVAEVLETARRDALEPLDADAACGGRGHGHGARTGRGHGR